MWSSIYALVLDPTNLRVRLTTKKKYMLQFLAKSSFQWNPAKGVFIEEFVMNNAIFQWNVLYYEVVSFLSQNI